MFVSKCGQDFVTLHILAVGLVSWARLVYGGPLYMICSPSLETSHHNFSGSRREKTSLSLTGTTEQ